MKIRRLSEIDLARLAPLQQSEKLVGLRSLRVGFPPHTYRPVRSCIGDLFNLQHKLFDEIDGLPATEWRNLEVEISKKSNSENEKKFNLAVAESIYDYVCEHKAVSYQYDVPKWSVGYGQSVAYWWSIYTVIDERAGFWFVDPRLSKPLTSAARRFVFSMMHERLRLSVPDFADAQLNVAQFRKGDDGSRILHVHTDGGMDLYSRNDLDVMIDETYQLWLQVLSENADAASLAAGTNPMGF